MMNVQGIPVGVTALWTPRGNRMALYTRETTNDGAIAVGIMEGDEYRLRDRHYSGWAIDVGAHIGAVTVALLLDNPDLQVVAIEPVPSSAELVRMNIAGNGVADRCHVLEGAAGIDGMAKITTEWEDLPPVIDAHYVHESRFVGNMLREPGKTIEVPSLSLAGVIGALGLPGDIDFLKIDCEGCEYRFLDSPDIGKVREIIGEYHDSGSWLEIEAMLGGTHDITKWGTGDIGTFVADRKA